MALGEFLLPGDVDGYASDQRDGNDGGEETINMLVWRLNAAAGVLSRG
jgi:hypothetical protein